MKRTWILLLSSLLFACSGEPTTNDKGAEEDPLTDGKEDSFFRPTEHGEASFSRANNAEITEDQTFHAWTFELTDEATLELTTEIATRNLDTVLYLYHRDRPDESWGRYIEKNDDHDGNLWSQIRGDFDAGLYRVIVKPFKSSMTGSVSLRASCEGGGCPVVEAGECTSDSYASLPAETGWGAGCDAAILDVVTSELQFQNQLDIPVGEKCDLNPLAARAVDYYVSYWDDVVGFEEVFGSGDPDEPIYLNVEEYTHDRGAVVWIDAHADEDGMRLVFDADGELLALHQSNQSPDDRFYCADDSSPGADFPGCWSNTIEELRWDIDNREGASGTLTVDEAGVDDEVNSDVISAIYHFSEAHSLEGPDEIAYEIASWEGTYTYGSEVGLVFEDKAATYWIGNTELVAISDAEGFRYLCEFVNL